jgi:ABC-2 type transport system permease protein
VSLQLIKNPAESINPAVLEELLGAVATSLNAISRNFHADFPEWQRVFEGKGDYHKVSFLIDQTGDQLKAAKQFIDPPLVGYEKEVPSDDSGNSETNSAGASKSAIGNRQPASAKPPAQPGSAIQHGPASIFSYLLLGMSAMFLLFLGQNAMTDLHRELRQRTFERYQTLRQQLWPFIFSKVLFTVVTLVLCSAIMLVGGGLAFGIHWRNPLPLAALVLGYGCFIAGLFAVLVAMVPDERRAAVLNNMVGMALGLVGGCAFPPRQLPEFLRDHITPLMPSFWFADTARSLQSDAGPVPWNLALLKLLLCAGILVALAAIRFRQKFKSGLRA